MAARKKAAQKKTAAKKKAPRKKATAKKKKAAPKRKTSRKKAPRKAAADLVGTQLPKSLKAFGAQLRRDLNAIEKQIEIATKDTRRSLTRIVRDASHQLGVLETRGEREWRKLSLNAERDVKKIVKRVRKATGN